MVRTYAGEPPSQRLSDSLQVSQKNRLVATLLCFFLGMFGIHRFYLGKIISGIAMLLTLGGLGIWSLIDLIMIVAGASRDAHGLLVSRWTTSHGTRDAVLAVALIGALLFVTGWAIEQFVGRLSDRVSKSFVDRVEESIKKNEGTIKRVIKQRPAPLRRGSSKPSKIVRYTDEHGRTHYVDSLEKVPAQYRNRVDKESLPEIVKLPDHQFYAATPEYKVKEGELFD